ncbi:YdcF family protein [Arcanobacterium pinnipediorum]|uniref:YdcF family protein n=1 Tax=Arcanobacterium pinnipediorum TaxID=1503041 RepID=A0ABY5AIT9_9ACTO|nr:YdcF family protein [Arcanobacterium pinnipediorum]USR79900.1 YdcF family protein [Arcanobacterium pinnipediorum]
MNVFDAMAVTLVIAGWAIVVWGFRRYATNPRRRHTGAFFIAGPGLVSIACVVVLAGGNLAPALLSAGYWFVLASGYLGLLLLGFAWFSRHAQARDSAQSFDVVIVLGAGLIGDRVSPLLARRVDRGIELVRASAQRGKQPLLICSGGRGDDEVISEAQAMETYAREVTSVPIRIWREESSTSTYENLMYSASIVRDVCTPSSRVGVATSNYHVLRTQVLVRRLGLDWAIFGAPAPTYLTSVSFLREFVALSLVWWPYVYGPLVVLTGAVVILR